MHVADVEVAFNLVVVLEVAMLVADVEVSYFADVEVALVVVVLVVAMHVADVEVVLYILAVQPLWLDMFS